MKQKAYRQNPTVIDLSKKPPTTGGNYAYIYELSNHLDTAYNALMASQSRGFSGRAHFVVQKNF